MDIDFYKNKFLNSNLNNDEEIENSLKYINYSNSPSNIQKFYDDLDNDDFDNILPLFFEGKKYNQTLTMYSLQSIEKLKFDDKLLKYLENGSIDKNLRTEKLHFSLQTWLNDNKAVWLSNQKENITLDDLVYKLGLYHLNTIEENQAFVLLSFEVEFYHKPSWFDAGLVFYFNAQNDTKEYGLTLNLLDASDGLKEFISKKDKIVLKDFEILKSSKILRLNQFTDTFRTNVKSKIKSLRG